MTFVTCEDTDGYKHRNNAAISEMIEQHSDAQIPFDILPIFMVYEAHCRYHSFGNPPIAEREKRWGDLGCGDGLCTKTKV